MLNPNKSYVYMEETHNVKKFKNKVKTLNECAMPVSCQMLNCQLRESMHNLTPACTILCFKIGVTRCCDSN